MRIGIAGYGGFGRFLHEAWKALPGVQVVAAATASPMSLHRARAEGVRAYPDWQQLVADPEVELVVVATPPHLHAVVARSALRARKPVLVEKPVALSLSEARRIQRLRDRVGIPVAVDYPLRFHPLIETLLEWTRRGVWGSLRRLTVEHYAQDESLHAGHWFWDRARSGGILVEHAVHFIDVTHTLCEAPPLVVRGLAFRRPTGQQDRMVLEALYANGLFVSQYHAFGRPGFFEHTAWRLVFDRLEVELEGWIPLRGRVRALVDRQTEQELKRLPGWQLQRRVPVEEAEDSSRPEGWGEEGLAPPTDRRQVRIHGHPYRVEALLEGAFSFPVSKTEMYAACVRAVLEDLLWAIEDSTHQLRTPLEAGIKSLDVALRATRSAEATLSRLSSSGRPISHG